MEKELIFRVVFWVKKKRAGGMEPGSTVAPLDCGPK